jgi:hypothetical protein
MIGVTQNVRAETSRRSFTHSYELLQWHFAGYGPHRSAGPNRPGHRVSIARQTGRAKLVKLYAGSLKIGKDIVSEIVNRTEGVSAAFIKELMRRAAQSAIERDPDGVLSSRTSTPHFRTCYSAAAA